MKALLELFTLLFWVLPKTMIFSEIEERKVKKLFYQDPLFAKADLFLQSLYRFKNPYKISKRYVLEKGLSSPHSYGETPLTVFHEMFKRGELAPKDTFVDLGCGRGRGALFANAFWKVPSIGVERVPLFCEKANETATLALDKKAQFLCRDIIDFEMKRGSFFYFYGLCMNDEELQRAVLHLETMRRDSKLVTVSFPITDYSSKFALQSSWQESYPWGKTDLFLHIKKC